MDELLKDLKGDLLNSDTEKIDVKLNLLNSIGKICGVANGLEEIFFKDKNKKTYVLDTLFLRDCYNHLTYNKNIETYIFVTGVEFDSYYILNKIIPVKLSKQSAVYARADDADKHRVLIELDETEHKLLAMFHDHMWKGLGATSSSETDRATQERYEKSGYPMISGIFSLDGYVTFFSNNYDFNILIYGKGVEQYGNTKSYRIKLS